jgi:hypothetical protein
MSHATCGTNRDCKNSCGIHESHEETWYNTPQNKWVRYKQCATVIVEKITTHHTVVDCLGNDACDLGPGTGGPCFFFTRSKVSQCCLVSPTRAKSQVLTKVCNTIARLHTIQLYPWQSCIWGNFSLAFWKRKGAGDEKVTNKNAEKVKSRNGNIHIKPITRIFHFRTWLSNGQIRKPLKINNPNRTLTKCWCGEERKRMCWRLILSNHVWWSSKTGIAGCRICISL